MLRIETTISVLSAELSERSSNLPHSGLREQEVKEVEESLILS
jgi:hypothetical protein